MKIFDCFIFNNEVELLELRLNILNDVVDKFVIVEGNSTFSGKKKESSFLKNKDRFITSGGMGAMGFGLPTSIGTFYGSKEKEILLISGDGSFQLNIQELEKYIFLMVYKLLQLIH